MFNFSSLANTKQKQILVKYYKHKNKDKYTLKTFKGKKWNISNIRLNEQGKEKNVFVINDVITTEICLWKKINLDPYV